jgi:nuclear transport factor 2 (NTF2) superfamily protein
MSDRPPLPPFTLETALQKTRMAENAWNMQDPEKISLAYTQNSRWRNRSEFIHGRDEIVAFLKRKWERELDYRLVKELWAFHDNRIAVRFQYECHIASGNWFRAYGNENWEFDEQGLMRRREASINDIPIQESERKFLWEAGTPRPDDYPGLTELGL